MNEVVNEVTKYSKLGHPRSTVKDTSPWEIAALGCDKWPMEDCIGDHGDHLRYKCWAKYVFFLWQLCILTKKITSCAGERRSPAQLKCCLSNIAYYCFFCKNYCHSMVPSKRKYENTIPCSCL